MNDIDQYRAFWGDQLRHWPEKTVRNLQVPEATKHFMVRVGLPIGQSWTMRFDGTLESPHNRPTYRIFGYDDLAPLCIVEPTGHVVHLEPGGATERYVNASLERFADFLVAYEQYRREVVAMEEEDDIDALIDRVESQMRSVDPSALEGPESFWSVILEQMRDGLL